MALQEWQRQDYTVSTDRQRLDLEAIHTFLSTSAYWALDRPYSVVKESIENSLCFGLYAGRDQVGLVRVVTDYATFAWLCDVYVLPSHRGQGLGKWLLECVFDHHALQTVRLSILSTRDAHEYYRRWASFDALEDANRIMIRVRDTAHDR